MKSEFYPQAPKPRLWLKTSFISHRNQSAWTLKERTQLRLFWLVWAVFARPTPARLCNRWRIWLLKAFGAQISGNPFVHPSAKVYAPFLLHLDDGVCLGPFCYVYNLGEVRLGRDAVLSAESMICNGTHDFDAPERPLLVGRTAIGVAAFLGIRAFVMPGVSVGDHAIVGACAVVTRDVPCNAIVGGNPARVLRMRRNKGGL